MSWFALVLLLLVLHGVILSAFVLLEQRHPMATLAWVLALILLPLVGGVLYYFFGRLRFHRRRKRRARALKPLEQAYQSVQASGEEEATALWEPLGVPSYHIRPAQTHAPASQFRPSVLPPEQRDSTPVIALAQRIVRAPLTQNNRIQVLRDADPTYAAMEAAIADAKHHVHVLYYIIREDATGAWLRDLLVEAAKRGVEVRLLYDAIGCVGTSDFFFQPLRDAGAKVAAFMPLRFRWSLRTSDLNFRNHRKLVIVDGQMGFTGGINIGDEYRGKDADLGPWRDTHLQIHGPSVHYLQHVFAEDWCHVTEELLLDHSYYPFEETQEAQEFPDELSDEEHQAMVQVVPSGPDQAWFPIRLLFFSALTSARHRAWLTTPYFVPDGAILTALTTAALRGVDVRLLLPARADSRIVHYAGRSYYRGLLQAGVKLYEYQRGMLHAKTMVIDSHYGTIGSANLDMRSFHINFEINAFVYSEPFAKELEQQFEEDLLHAKEIQRVAFSQRPVRERLFEATARIFSPLL